MDDRNANDHGRTLDDHEEITDHVFLVIVILSSGLLLPNNSPSGIIWIQLRYKNVVIVCGGGVAKGSRQQRIFARPPAPPAAAG